MYFEINRMFINIKLISWNSIISFNIDWKALIQVFYTFTMLYDERPTHVQRVIKTVYYKLNPFREAVLIKNTMYTCRFRRNTRNAILWIREKYEEKRYERRNIGEPFFKIGIRCII